MAKAKRTCSIEGCERTHKSRGWCATHYMRWRTHGYVGSADVRGDYKECTVEGCEEAARARGWCTFHYTRWKLTGDPLTPTTRARPYRGEICEVEGCNIPKRKMDMCAVHYDQQWRTGREPWQIARWSEVGECPVCGGPTGVERGFRKHCSAKCRKLYYDHDGDVPHTFECVHCGDTFPLVVDGYRINHHIKRCKRCRQDTNKHGHSVLSLAKRDGNDCGICGDEVDMTAEHPDLMRPSVDHIIPRANGGDNEPENVQLSHLHCNFIKSDSGWRLGKRQRRRDR